ncbi:hypothetical protein CHR53_03535 [Neobacillus mesonae]|uniref:Glycosyltransferase 2-like domain-containing protein n=2 Tax=Neobacillus mesonae TaxID=1193713 RepID=A0A3T0HTH7_9BACI|nr:hypothetical protein CHR53_03535 [Neobacillus mesonae]
MCMTNRLSIIIPAYNDGDTLPSVISQCQALCPYEIIIVANGCTDNTEQIALNYHCKLISDPEPLGHDVGRAVGAANASGDVLLFLDADISIPSQQLQKFLEPIYTNQAEVVLNHIPLKPNSVHPVVIWKRVFNALMGEQHFGLDTLTAVPIALTRYALNQIGIESMMNPGIATLKTFKSNLPISNSYQIDLSKNKSRIGHQKTGTNLSFMQKVIIGDYVEGLSLLQLPNLDDHSGPKKIEMLNNAIGETLTPQLNQITPIANYDEKTLSVVMTLQQKVFRLHSKFKCLAKLPAHELIVVMNSDLAEEKRIAKEYGAKIITVNDPLVYEAYQAIGAKAAQGDIILTINGTSSFKYKEICDYIERIANGADLVLTKNNLKRSISLLLALQYAFNLAVDRKDLGASSLLSKHTAMSRKGLNIIGWESLHCPPLAQLKGILNGLSIVTSSKCVSNGKDDKDIDLHMKDYLVALQYLIKEKGPRGLFANDGRKRNKV